MNARPKICVLVPTYNNGATLSQVLGGILRHCQDVIVVNDGSTDDTSSILKSFPVTVVSYPSNRGKGYALKRGFEEARSRGFDYAVTIDSDGQHYPDDLPLMFQTASDSDGALVVGTRTLPSENISGGSTFANKFSNFWFHLQTGSSLSDTQSGFRAYPLAKLPPLWLLTNRYEAELGLLVLSAWRGVRLISVPVGVYYPPKEERVSSFRPVRDFTRISVLNVILCTLALVYGWPRMLLSKLSGKR